MKERSKKSAAGEVRRGLDARERFHSLLVPRTFRCSAPTAIRGSLTSSSARSPET